MNNVLFYVILKREKKNRKNPKTLKIPNNRNLSKPKKSINEHSTLFLILPILRFISFFVKN